MKHSQHDPCAHCEEMMQPYIDHILTEADPQRKCGNIMPLDP